MELGFVIYFPFESLGLL